MRELDLDELVRGTADAAFVVDGEGTIVAWNASAERLLGLSAASAVGHACHDILCGRDPFGNRYCGEHCAVARMADRLEPLRRFTISVRRAQGARASVDVCVVQLPEDRPGRPSTLHLLFEHVESPSAEAVPLSRSIEEVTVSGSASEREKLRTLTPREVEVLRLLAIGHASNDIANELFISLATVRTHTQNILRKLGAHSQIEAVALAYRGGLI